MGKNWTKEEQKAHRAELVAALRSGKYKQGRGHLRGDDGFCCLGVACDVSKLGEWAQPDYGPGALVPHWLYATKSGEEGAAALPSDVADYYGFRRTDGSLGNGSRYRIKHIPFRALTTANDSGAVSFEQIADVIESEPEGMFE